MFGNWVIHSQISWRMNRKGAEHICPTEGWVGACSPVVVPALTPAGLFLQTERGFLLVTVVSLITQRSSIDCIWICISFLFVSIKSTLCLRKPFRLWPMASGGFLTQPLLPCTVGLFSLVCLWLSTVSSMGFSALILICTGLHWFLWSLASVSPPSSIVYTVTALLRRISRNLYFNNTHLERGEGQATDSEGNCYPSPRW